MDPPRHGPAAAMPPPRPPGAAVPALSTPREPPPEKAHPLVEAAKAQGRDPFPAAAPAFGTAKNLYVAGRKKFVLMLYILKVPDAVILGYGSTPTLQKLWDKVLAHPERDKLLNNGSRWGRMVPGALLGLAKGAMVQLAWDVATYEWGAASAAEKAEKKRKREQDKAEQAEERKRRRAAATDSSMDVAPSDAPAAAGAAGASVGGAVDDAAPAAAAAPSAGLSDEERDAFDVAFPQWPELARQMLPFLAMTTRIAGDKELLLAAIKGEDDPLSEHYPADDALPLIEFASPELQRDEDIICATLANHYCFANVVLSHVHFYLALSDLTGVYCRLLLVYPLLLPVVWQPSSDRRKDATDSKRDDRHTAFQPPGGGHPGTDCTCRLSGAAGPWAAIYVVRHTCSCAPLAADVNVKPWMYKSSLDRVILKNIPTIEPAESRCTW